jgi:non-ribosomal peptide synthetase component F
VLAILEDSEPAVILTSRWLANSLPETQGIVVFDDEDYEGLPNTPYDTTLMPDAEAYLIYTSGSTGIPKGISVTQRNLISSTAARHIRYNEAPGVFLLLSSFSFDSSLAGIFWTLTSGGRLEIAKEYSVREPDEIVKLVEAEQVTHILALPALYDQILEHGAERLGTLKTVIVAGESCPLWLITKHRGRLPNTRIYNEYGPTEATVWCSVWEGSPTAGEMAPIGHPVANSRLYVLDEHMEPAPVGVEGDLWVGGAGVVRGYNCRQALTAESFLPDSFTAEPGRRLYRT